MVKLQPDYATCISILSYPRGNASENEDFSKACHPHGISASVGPSCVVRGRALFQCIFDCDFVKKKYLCVSSLVSFNLMGALCVCAGVREVNIVIAWIYTGSFLGAMMPCAFAAWAMSSIGEAAHIMAKEGMCQMSFAFAVWNLQSVVRLQTRQSRSAFVICLFPSLIGAVESLLSCSSVVPSVLYFCRIFGLRDYTENVA